MSSGERPPRVAEAMLVRALGRTRSAEAIAGDLREEFAGLCRRRGRWAAAVWYWMQAARLTTRRLLISRGGRRIGAPLARDLALAARSLGRRPGYTLLAAATIGLGLGANTAIFAVLHAIVLEPLPLGDPERVVVVRHRERVAPDDGQATSYPLYEDYRRGQRAFSEMAAWRFVSPSLTTGDGAEALRATAVGVSATMFEVLGLRPHRGRFFTPSDEAPGSPRVAVVSHAFWSTRLGGEADPLGGEIRLDGEPYTVVGVLPAAYARTPDAFGRIPPGSAQVWLPYENSPAVEGTDVRGLVNVGVLGRLREGVDVADAQRDLAGVLSPLAEVHEEHAEIDVVLTRAADAVTGNVLGVAFLLFGAVTLVLVIAAANVASMVLGRTVARRRELSLRRALGCGRRGLARLMLAESAWIALLGGLASWGLARVGLAAVTAIDPGSLERLRNARIGAESLAFLGVAAVLVMVALTVVPMVGVVGGGAAGDLRSRSARDGRLRHLIVVGQFGLATVLLIGGGLFTRSLLTVLEVDPGFDADGVLVARVQLPGPFVNPDWPRNVRFFDELRSRLEAVPGVEAVATAYAHPAGTAWTQGFTVAGRPDPPPGERPVAEIRTISPGYFAALGVTVVAGREFTPADHQDAPGATVINRALADRHLPGVDPLGEVLEIGHYWGARPPEFEIVGVVENVRFHGPTGDHPPAFYLNHAQWPLGGMHVLVKAAGEDPTVLAPAVRAAVHELDPTLPVEDVATLSSIASRGAAAERFLALVVGAFSVLAAVLACLGLYGALSFLVEGSRRELGVRLAVGSGRARVVRLLMGRGLRLAGAGLVVGLVGGLLAGRVLEGFLFGVRALDPWTYVVVPTLLLISAVAATGVPAARAARVEPAETLRSE